MVRTDFTSAGFPGSTSCWSSQASSTLNLGVTAPAERAASVVAVVALVRRRLRLATGATLVLVIINARFYDCSRGGAAHGSPSSALAFMHCTI